MIIPIVFSVLVISTVLIYVVSRRYKIRSLLFVLSNLVGFVFCALLGNLIFSIVMEDSGVFFADYGSLVGGGLGWTAVVISIITVSHSCKEQPIGLELATENSVVVSYSTLQTFWVLAIRVLTAVLLAVISATVLDFIVFVIYGFIGFEITEIPILIARLIYISVCIVVSYFISSYLFQRKARLIHQVLYPDHLVSALQMQQETFVQEDKPKKKVWLWWLGGCGVLACIVVLGIILFLVFYQPDEPSYLIDGNVSFPSTVKKGDDFDFIITLTNSTAEPVFIKHIVLHDFLTAPSLLVGAKVISVEPDMDSELLGSRNDVQFAYFREIKPGETLTVVFHMQAENVGTYYEDVGVYAKDPSKPDPAFIAAYQYNTAQIEVIP